MWTKFSNALKPRQDSAGGSAEHGSTEVMSKVLEEHPNMSMFREPPPNASSSNGNLEPPSSPSKMKAVFKRLSKNPLTANGSIDEHPPRAASPFKMPNIGNPKKIKPFNNANSESASCFTFAGHVSV
jgi:hypothetical protein